MRRLRLSTLMLLVVVAAFGVAALVQHRRAALRDAELGRLRARLQAAEAKAAKLEETDIAIRWYELSERRLQSRPGVEPGAARGRGEGRTGRGLPPR